MQKKLTEISERYGKLTERLSAPETLADLETYTRLNKERAQI